MSTTLGHETERSVQRKVIELARTLGFHVLCDSAQGYRPGGRRHATTRITKGFPDLLLGHPAKQASFFVEVKRAGGKLSADQEAWHGRARACGLVVLVCDSAASFAEQMRTYGFEVTGGVRSGR